MVRSETLVFVLLTVGGLLARQPDSKEGNKAVLRALADAGISIDLKRVLEDSFEGNTRPEDNGGVVAFHPRRTRSTGLDWNIIVDNLLVQARQYIIEDGKDEISIPDINERFEKRYGFIKATGRFEAWEGRVNSLSSIRRTGEVFFSSVPGQSVTLTTNLGFGTLRVRYNGYKAEIWNFGPRGSIEASVGSNSVRLRLRMDIIGENSCKLVLEEAVVETLDGFDVNVTGLGPLNWLTSKIVTWVAENRRGDIKENAGRELRRALERSVQNLPCDPEYINI